MIFIKFFRKHILLLLVLSSLSLQADKAHDSYGIKTLIESTQEYSKEQGFRGTLNWQAFEQEIKNIETLFPNLQLSIYGRVASHNLYKIHLQSSNDNALRVAVFAGVHGNEILAVPIALSFLKEMAKQENLNIDLSVYPAIAPQALIAGTRRVRNGIDLNRHFKADSQEPEVKALIKDLFGKRFDIAFDVHGAVTREHFFVIRASDDKGLATRSLKALNENILLSSNDGRYPGKAGIPSDPERYTLYSPGVAESLLVGTLKEFIHKQGTTYSYTSEYPGRMEPNTAIQNNIKMFVSFLKTLSNQ
jgi:hypothetical protein